MKTRRRRKRKDDVVRKFYYKDNQITPKQAVIIKALGGDITIERSDDWFWKHWE